jgi:hypothetical protein
MGTNRQTEACNVPGASGYRKLFRFAGNFLLWLARKMNTLPKLPNARVGAPAHDPCPGPACRAPGACMVPTSPKMLLFRGATPVHKRANWSRPLPPPLVISEVMMAIRRCRRTQGSSLLISPDQAITGKSRRTTSSLYSVRGTNTTHCGGELLTKVRSESFATESLLRSTEGGSRSAKRQSGR